MASQKKVRYNAQYNKDNYMDIRLRPRIVDGLRIRFAAEKTGMSLNAFVLKCVYDVIGHPGEIRAEIAPEEYED